MPPVGRWLPAQAAMTVNVLELAPFEVREGRLVLEQVDLEELGEGLQGRAAWVVSEGALGALVASCSSPQSVAVGDIGPPALLGRLAVAGWWARCHSVHELELASAAGFDASRSVAAGSVRDDGFLKEALTRGVAVLEVGSAAQRENVARIARFLDAPVPREHGSPPLADDLGAATLGGLLAPVLVGGPRLELDAPWPPSGPGALAEPAPLVHVWPLRPGVAVDVSLEGLSHAGSPGPLAARLHGEVARGDWVVLPSVWAARLRSLDRAHPEPPTVVVRGASWRPVEPRVDPATRA